MVVLPFRAAYSTARARDETDPAHHPARGRQIRSSSAALPRPNGKISFTVKTHTAFDQSTDFRE